MDFSEFRGFDLRERKEKIKKAMDLVPPETAEDIPVIAHVPCYFGFGNHPRPREYWEDPAVMLAFQQDGYERHLELVDDDTVPYFMPWFGTGVLASGVGCQLREATGQGNWASASPGSGEGRLDAKGPPVYGIRSPARRDAGWNDRSQQSPVYGRTDLRV